MLNAAQRQAVEHDQGPLLVLAGAGSGKTRVITQRIGRILERGVSPTRVLAVSFTNKAADEMRERLEKVIGPQDAKRVWLSTFHRFGVRFLQSEAQTLWGTSRFVVLDQGDCSGLLKELFKREAFAERKLDMAAIQSRISFWKNAFKSPEDIDPSSFEFEYDAVAAAVFARYEERLRALRAVDFDDLIVLPARLLRDRDDIRARWQARFDHILVDEFQDTNRVQLELVRQLVDGRRNVCVVGDDDQSIYSWRGADVQNIRRFDRHFPGTQIVKLEDNYRSYAPILEVANAVIAASNEQRHLKVLRAARGTGEQVRAVEAPDADAEVRFLIREIRSLRQSDARFGDMAVLYRSNLQARLVEQELRANGMPYQLLGGTQYFDRKEVKDALAYLRMLVYPDDELSLRRILNYPPRGVGDTSVERISNYALAQDLNFVDAVRAVRRIDRVPENAQRGCEMLLRALDEARLSLERQSDVEALAVRLFTEVGLFQELNESAKGGKNRRENLDFLLAALRKHKNEGEDAVESLRQLIQRLTLRIEEKETERDQITLATLHASKGLEFPNVFILGCVEGQLPHSRTTDPKVTEVRPGELEEERRLFYVGITRAQDRLYLMVPRARVMRGKRLPLTPSRFLDGLPEGALSRTQAKASKALDADELAAMSAALLQQLGG